MTEEIKEILKYIDQFVYVDQTYNDIKLSKIDTKLILDYITNLQQDLDKANDIIEKDRQFNAGRLLDIAKLKEENERLKEENKRIFSKVNDDELLISNAMNYAEAQDYKSRCEKANKWVDKHTKIYTKNGISIIDWDNLSDPRKLINILNGSDEK